jgi:hypothetical protein
LEIGPGNGRFLRLLAPICRNAGVESFAVGLTFDSVAAHLLEIQGVRAIRGDACDLGRILASRRVDLIIAVGVLSLATVRAVDVDGADRVRLATGKHLRLLRSGLDRLSDHPQAAFIACSPITFLILNFADVEATARVLAWEIADHKLRPEWFRMQRQRFLRAFSLNPSELRSYQDLWLTSADGAILARVPEAGAERAPHNPGGPADDEEHS